MERGGKTTQLTRDLRPSSATQRMCAKEGSVLPAGQKTILPAGDAAATASQSTRRDGDRLVRPPRGLLGGFLLLLHEAQEERRLVAIRFGASLRGLDGNRLRVAIFGGCQLSSGHGQCLAVVDGLDAGNGQATVVPASLLRAAGAPEEPERDRQNQQTDGNGDQNVTGRIAHDLRPP